MKLFTGEIEVKETDTIEVYQDYLTVFDKNGNMTYFENSDEYWIKREYDKNGKGTCLEDSYSKIIDNRLKEITIEELAKMGYKLKEK